MFYIGKPTSVIINVNKIGFLFVRIAIMNIILHICEMKETLDFFIVKV